MRLFAFLLAVAGGFLWSQDLPPESHCLNQLVAVIGWGVVLFAMPAPAAGRDALRRAMPLLALLAIIGGACAYAWATGGQGQSPALATLASLAMAGLLVVHGASWGARDAATSFRPFALAMAAAGVGGAVIAVAQFLDPNAPTGLFITVSAFPGRSAGNLGQPNHLADSLVLGLAALGALAAWKPRSRPVQVGLLCAGVLVIEGVVLSGSRTGMLGTVLLAIWGILDRDLPRFARRALIASPLVAGVLWPASQSIASWTHVAVEGFARSSSDVTASRGAVWHDALALIAAQPWFGVGWGQFNFAWTLTPFAHRPDGFDSNAHNLLLHLAVVLGVPLATLCVGCIVVAAWKAVAGVRRRAGEAGIHARSALVMVAMVGLHSMLEFPLWYLYFLLPTAWAWGFALGAGAPGEAPAASRGDAGAAGTAPAEAQPSPARTWRILGIAMVVAGASAWADYLNIVAIYLPGADAPPLVERVRRGEASPLFSRHAEITAALTTQPAAAAMPQIEHSARGLLDGKLLYVWANALAQRGEIEKARYIADRMREFHRTEIEPFFAPCNDASVAEKPFQCTPARPGLTWRDFR